MKSKDQTKVKSTTLEKNKSMESQDQTNVEPTPLKDRYSMVVLFDGAMTSPNGDPDNGSLPRQDPYNGTGHASPVSLKRKMRDTAAYLFNVKLYHANGVVLREQRATALVAAGHTPSVEDTTAGENDAENPAERRNGKSKPTREAVSMCDLRRNQLVICKEYWDARTFGAVMDTGAARAANARGPVIVSWARSVDPVQIFDYTITRQSVEKVERDKRRDMGSAPIIRYGLYRFDISVEPWLAERTGFSTNDMDMLREVMVNMFEFSSSASRRLNLRGIYAFRHESTDGKPSLGRAPHHSLISRVSVSKKAGVDEPTSFDDYLVSVDKDTLPTGITLEQWA